MQKLPTTCDDGDQTCTIPEIESESTWCTFIIEWHYIRWILWIFLFGSCIFMCILASYYFTFDEAYFAQKHYKNESLLVYIHILPAFFCQFLASFQLLSPLRRRFMRIHRWFGRIYVCCCFISCIGSFGMSLNAEHGGLSTQISLIILTVLWFASTLIGFYHIRKAKQYEKDTQDEKLYHIKQHRMWMLRSYALMISPAIARYWLMLFLYGLNEGQSHGFYGEDALRYYQQIRIVDGKEYDEYYYRPEYVAYSNAYTAASWVSWALNLIIVELYMWFQANHIEKAKLAL